MLGLRLATVLLLACCAAGCAPRSAAPTVPLSAATAPRIGLTGDYLPFCGSNSDAWLGYDGFDLRLAQRFVVDLQLGTPVAAPFLWPELAARMSQGTMDLALCGITLRGDRALSMAFTRPYAVSGAVAVVLPASRDRFPTLESLDRPAVRLAVNAGGHLERVARRQFPHATIQPTANNLSLPDLLTTAQADAVVSDNYEASTWRDVVTYGPFTHDRKAVALPLDHLALRDQLNDWLAAREMDGWLDDQRAKLGEFARLTPQQACYEALAADIDLRFSLMPSVAAVKRRDGVPIEDASQEAAVLARARAEAVRLHLSADGAASLFKLLIRLAKEIQSNSPEPPPGDLTLAQVRIAVAAASAALLPEVQRCAPFLQSAEQSIALERVIAADLQKHSLPSSAARQITQQLFAAAANS
jgi:cyclohexadienyl dehydratase